MFFQKKIRIHVRRLVTFKEIFKSESSCTYCSAAKIAAKKITSNKGMKQFFQSDSELFKIYPHIPSKYLRQNSVSEHFYLISPKIAKDIAKKIMPFLDLSGKQLIAETNAGLGLITLELLKEGVNLVRMYESCSEFRTELKDFGKIYPNNVELFTKDLFHLSRYATLDKHDRLNRVENLFVNVTKRSWTDEPFMSVIGAMDGLSFLRYLVRSVALQITPSNYGRIQTFALMKTKEYAILAATPVDSNRIYTKLTILFNLVFDVELLGRYPKKAFVPWTTNKEVKYCSPYKNFEFNSRYLVRINFKKKLPLEAEKLLYFIFFLEQVYNYGNDCIIPKLEKWLPGSGANVICTTFETNDSSEEINIFTKFRELSPQQILKLFEVIVEHPLYKESSFMEMVQSELMRHETIETSMADADLEFKLLDDIQEKLNDEE